MSTKSALVNSIDAQVALRQYVEANGIDPEDPTYVNLRSARDAAVNDFDAELSTRIQAGA